MKTLFLSFALLLVINLEISAQVAINNDGSSPDNSAILDVKSTAAMSYYLRMFYNNDDTNIDYTFKSVGSSVRCVKD